MKLSNSSFFFLGDAGSGKTTLAAQFPKPYFFDFDKGMMAAAGKSVEYDTFRDASKNGKAWPDDGIYPYAGAYDKFLARLAEIGKQIDDGTCPYQTLVFDSVTMLASILMNKIMKENPAEKPPKDIPQIQHYGAEHQKLKEFFDTITGWPLIKIMTGHIHRDEDALSGATTLLPLLTPKIGAKAPIYFDEVYFVEVEPARDNKPAKRVLRTDSTAKMRAARSRFGVPTGTEATWAAIRKAIADGKKVDVDV
jgi:GTPase SAR1 family protein